MDYKEKCLLEKGEEGKAIYDSFAHLSIFGSGHSIKIYSECMNTKDNFCELSNNTYHPKNYHGIDPDSFLAGSKNFYVDELEVFQVI